MNEQSISMIQAPLAPEALAEEWDKTFPLSEKVNHKKVTASVSTIVSSSLAKR